MKGSPIAYSPLANLAGAEGFEPSNTGSKDPRLTTWRRPTTLVLRPVSTCEEADYRSGFNHAVQTVSVADGLSWRQVPGVLRSSAIHFRSVTIRRRRCPPQEQKS